MSAFTHKPVMVREVLEALDPKSGLSYADGTVGSGGHAAAILEASSPDGRLYVCDRDAVAVRAATERLRPFAARCEIRQGNFAELADWVKPNSCNGVLLDLGVSSPQLEEAERGFSFLHDGPLDMRMDERQSLTAAELVNDGDLGELARIFWEYGGEREARRIARAIGRERALRRIATTGQLAALIERFVFRKGRKTHPATRVFQALRLAINDELGSLERGLNAAWTILKSGGRLVVITFHSLEDRLVRDFARRLERDYRIDGNVDLPELRRPAAPELRRVHRKALLPDAAEVAENPRARSAQLRVLEKI